MEFEFSYHHTNPAQKIQNSLRIIYEVDQYLNKALNMVAEHSKDSIVFVPCFPVIERPFLPVTKE